ncbi:hypothetical protein [Anaerocolumna chitinilytica]|uniref:Uncharacterized protein n=1 Tax=Anaerocolumna chitinilytica TaxID=1727145 RepID=A0A7I8DL71_9FIRM|nr:hypothetical protein [Anaerocolumna chitinilytica]BCJ99110.1 hypothetical protein bsdcttw_21510 [Anaerocolumna chitinilytica]
MDFLYIKTLKTQELLTIIQNIEGFEEAGEALLELKGRDSQLALQLGGKIITDNLGDDYLQGFAFILLYGIDPEAALKSYYVRKEKPSAKLFIDVCEELESDFFLDKRPSFLTNTLLEFLTLQYEKLEPAEQRKIEADWENFRKKFMETQRKAEREGGFQKKL